MEMIAKEQQSMDLTDRVLRLKKAFEGKNIEALRAEFSPNVRINSNGRFYTLAHLVEGLQKLFATVDQTYMDVVGVTHVEADERGSFGVFDVDLAWIDKRDWMEKTQKVTLSIEAMREPREPVKQEGRKVTNEEEGRRARAEEGLAITGLSVATRVTPKDVPGVSTPQDFPRDVGGNDNKLDRPFDIFSFWY
jgi:hypothetical protein